MEDDLFELDEKLDENPGNDNTVSPNAVGLVGCRFCDFNAHNGNIKSFQLHCRAQHQAEWASLRHKLGETQARLESLVALAEEGLVGVVSQPYDE